MKCATCGTGTKKYLRIFPRGGRPIRGLGRCDAHLGIAAGRLQHAGYGTVIVVEK